MKDKVLPIAICTLLSVSGFAQYPMWQMEVSLGYGNDFQSQTPEGTVWVSSQIDGQGNYAEQKEYYSYGNGPKASITLGARLSKGLAIDGQFSYSYGLPSTIDREGFFGSTELTIGGQHTSFSPMLRLYKEFRYWDDAYIYARVGPVLGLSSTFLESDFDGASVSRLEYDWNFSVGFQGGLGLAVPVNGNTSFILELQYVHLNSKPNHAEFTKVEVNGEDQRPNMTTNQKEIDFVDNVVYVQGDDDEPQQRLRINSPFSHFAFNLGLRFTL